VQAVPPVAGVVAAVGAAPLPAAGTVAVVAGAVAAVAGAPVAAPGLQAGVPPVLVAPLAAATVPSVASPVVPLDVTEPQPTTVG